MQTAPDIAPLLAVLAATIVATKLLGDLAQRGGLPAVLGELVAGVLLGGSALGLLNPHEPVMHALAELGALVLLFEIGLHTDLRSLRRVGGAASAVAAVGVVLPFAGGFGVARALGVGPLAALVAGAVLTATSIGISARVLRDVGRLETPEGQVVLGAAVLDDVIGLIIVAVISGLVAGAGVSLLGVVTTAGRAVGFIAVALAVGSVAVPPMFRLVERLHVSGALGLVALALALALAWLAERSGSAVIIGAFAAGLLLHANPRRATIESSVATLGHFFVPIFFAVVGASVDLRVLAEPRSLALGAALLAVGVAGKVAAGYAPVWLEGNKLLIGVAMVPRGEVGLIFAQMGLAAGAISAELFGALVLVVVVTTFVTPPLLGRIARRPGPSDDQPVEGGIDDLVAGTRRVARTTVRVQRQDDNE